MPGFQFLGSPLPKGIATSGKLGNDGLEEGAVSMACSPDYNSPPASVQENPTAAEAKDAPPVASVGEVAFRILAGPAIDQGWVKQETVDHIAKILYQEVPRD